MGCDAFRIDDGFIRRHVEMPVLLMHAPKPTPIGLERRASALAGMAVDLVAAIAVIIPRPLAHTMTASSMRWMAPPIALPLVGIELRAVSRDVLRYQCCAGGPISMVANPEALLTGVARDEADDGGTIVGVSPVPSPLIGPPTRRIIRVRGGVLVFPRFVVQLVPTHVSLVKGSRK